MDISMDEKIYDKIRFLILKYDKVFSDEELEELNNNGLFDECRVDYDNLMGRCKKESEDSINVTDFTIKCSMKDRWVPYFISFLKRIEKDGETGESDLVGFYVDGDSDFRAKFKFDSSEVNDDVYNKIYPHNADTIIDYYDADCYYDPDAD